jgi:hypothetical protein
VTCGPDGLLVSLGRVLSPAALQRARFKSLLGFIAKTLRIKRAAKKGQDGIGSIKGSSSAIVAIDKDGKARFCNRAQDTQVPNHNVIQADEWLVYNDSNDGRVVATQPTGAQPDRTVSIPGQPSFARGLAQREGFKFFVGSQAPFAIYEVDLEHEEIVSTILPESEPNESVYSICLLPSLFETPPSRLEKS